MLDGGLRTIVGAIGPALHGRIVSAESHQLAPALVEDAEHEVFGLRIADDRTEQAPGRRTVAARHDRVDTGRVGCGS